MSSTTSDSQPWWKYGHVWLIISGPLVVVVAAIATMVIAIRVPDPLVTEDYYRKGLEINKTLAAEKEAQMMPALDARNHAATPKAQAAAPASGD